MGLIELYNYYVYFIQNTNTRAIKIGYTSNVKSRLSILQSSSPDKLKLLEILPGDWRDEKDFHYRFKHLRIKGEWFNPADDLIKFIKSIGFLDRSRLPCVCPVCGKERSYHFGFNDIWATCCMLNFNFI